MDFKTRKITRKSAKLPKPGRRINISMPVALLIVLIAALLFGTFKAVSTIDYGVVLSIAGDKLAKDTYGHTNILVLGMGGVGHDGGDLTDTMIVASIDKESKTVSMLSIPRDFYVKDSQVGNSRINEVYYNAKNKFNDNEKGLDYLKKRVEEIVGIPIHYWVKIDFKGFRELVDALGGIDIEVENDLYDPYYPLDGTYEYQTFQIKKGFQHIDGATALKYARSRKTTSDFDRARRQQQIIYAIKEQALKLETIFSKEKITKILQTLKDNIDTNITPEEILTFGSYADDFQAQNITHRLIHDDPTQCGGFLYTPERQYYNNMFVLIPAGGLEMIHLYSNLNFNYPLVAREKIRMHILNGTARGGVAGETKQILQRLCFDIVRFGNGQSKEIAETTYYIVPQINEKGEKINTRPDTLDFLQQLIPGKESFDIPQLYLENGYNIGSDVILELGTDYVNSENYLNDPFYSLY